MDFDVAALSRIQFALTIMFHYLFPPLSIGLSALMVVMEALYLGTGDAQYHRMTRFWTKLFAANFAMGVATGIVMEFEFGTNWADYARYVGDIFGSALAAEGIFAFFLESGFLAVLVFGWDRVGPKMHFFATLMVALGSTFSAVWIIIANSWQHTPAGFALETHTFGDRTVTRAVITDFWAVVFSPSSMQRLAHTILAAFILGAFFVMSISAYYVLRRRHLDFARRSFTIALFFGAASSLAILLSGHLQARTMAHTQPAKMAAFEGHFHTGVAEAWVIGLPDGDESRVRFGVGVPGGLSFLIYDDFNHPVTGLDAFRPEDRPGLIVPFMTYHLMVGLGMGFIGLTLLAIYFWWRGTLFDQRWLMMVFVVAVVGPYLANQAGWVATETGRQPFVVYPRVIDSGDGTFRMEGGLRTVDGLSNTRVVKAGQVLGSILMFSFVYILLFAVWVYVLNSKIHHGPDEDAPKIRAEGFTTPFFDAASQLANPGGQSLTKGDSAG